MWTQVDMLQDRLGSWEQCVENGPCLQGQAMMSTNWRARLTRAESAREEAHPAAALRDSYISSSSFTSPKMS